jgi:hypothetical protein
MSVKRYEVTYEPLGLTNALMVLAGDYDRLDRDCDGYIEDRDALAARLAEHEAEVAALKAALTRLTDSFKYSTEVVTIAREALSGAGTADEVKS